MKIPYTRVIAGVRFFEPRGRMVEHGFRPRSLGLENEMTRRAAWKLYEDWLTIRDGRQKPQLPDDAPPEAVEMAINYPAGSIGAAWKEWVQDPEWRRLSSSNRSKIWWPAWRLRIRPVFAYDDPNTVTHKQISEWREAIEAASGIDAAHKALKVWRALWGVMQVLRYTQMSDPSRKIVNTAPKPRDQRYTHGEAMLRAKAAWRAGFRGLACAIAIAWDTGFSPQDVRTLRFRHLVTDPKTGRTILDRSRDGRGKTGAPVIGTLSRFGDLLLGQYLGSLGVAHHDEAFVLLTRTGQAYTDARLSRDFQIIRGQVDPNDRRQLRDMRRSGVLETFTGGGEARDVAEKFGNTIDRSSFLFKTYNPVDIEKVRKADEARLEGRRRRNRSGT